ncbi:gamma-D-glutamyl-{L}-meso-diaminopimelate peptidase I [Natranaerovirga hydrolytica]|uniref:Gamma-D-glutamyl-(L)-meso-diaminopimelate peptidase I n=2 Tax=Natranaerovirga hydrolytica TaxID=680378 RepID=A0A4R1N543_9FIRM|nr:gamma-D-glutamyl-{L}-meso-diaminopimelate peptidase I [Natranaerovirga hydrolytica]
MNKILTNKEQKDFIYSILEPNLKFKKEDGSEDKHAISRFQKENNLEVTSKLDEATFKKLMDQVNGFEDYIIKKDDKLFDLMKRKKSLCHKTLTANPKLNPFLLNEGQSIAIPYNKNVVPTHLNYTYDILEMNLKSLSKRYPFIKVDSIGKSVDNRALYRVRLGKGKKRVSFNGSHHGNEWITSLFLMVWLENFLNVYSYKGYIKGYSTAKIWNRVTLDIIPMVNPDGVELVTNGLKNIIRNRNRLYRWNNYQTNFSNWKANINGVDLNRNYDANFNGYKKVEKEMNIFGPSPALYSGDFPGCEPESKAMIETTLENKYDLMMAYHTQGEEIFYTPITPSNNDSNYQMALELSEISGYQLAVPDVSQAYAGYKDWFVTQFKKPGFTIEAGKGTNPIPIQQLPIIYEQNEAMLLKALYM